MHINSARNFVDFQSLCYSFSMSKMELMFSQYELSHKHRVNRLIHYVCVPAIVWSLLAILYWIPVPQVFGPSFHWSDVPLVFGLTYYVGLKNLRVLLLMSVVLLLMMLSIVRLGQSFLWIEIGVFVFSWVFQFIGHKIEGKKPSFFEDLFFLLIGPLWVLESFFRALGVTLIPKPKDRDFK